MCLLSIFLLTFVIYYSHSPLFKPLFVLLNAGVIGLAMLEYYQLARQKGYQALQTLSIGAAVMYVIATYLSIQYSTFQYVPSLVLLLSLVLFFLAFFQQQSNPVANLAITVFGFVYLALPLTCILGINYESADHGRFWLTYILVVTKITDMGAYIIGKLFGKNKLAEKISPKKTIEGACGGLIIALAASMAFYYFFMPTETLLTLWQSIWLGLIIGILAQVGDLAESILKRDAGVKDSSHIPGFGGMLDVVDSLVFTVPLMYLLLKMQVIG